MKHKDIPVYITSEFSNSILTIKLLGPSLISKAQEITAQSQKILKAILNSDANLKAIKIDLSELKQYDTFVLVYINEIREICDIAEIDFRYFGQSEDIDKFIALLMPKTAQTIKPKINKLYNYINQLGEQVLVFFHEIKEFIEFFGKTTTTIAKAFVKPSTIRWKDFPGYFTEAGVKALSVNLLIVLLIGFIIGWQGALLLRQFGASPYLAPLVGFSVIRELAPLMVAIVVAGRSGAAFTAEIGTMKVSEELDALETMGFDIYGFLILPRVFALMIAVPILVMICDVIGVLGGLVAGLTTLNITMISYFTSLAQNIAMADITYGLIKAVVFGFTIALIGCFCGLKVTNSSESVGKQTTLSVVISIFMVIVIDAVFVIIFDAIN